MRSCQAAARGLLFALAVTGAQASPAAEQAEELQGVLINQTRSVAGQAFYTGFFTLWQVLDQQGLYSLVITEKPFPQFVGSSLVSVTYDDTVVYRKVIHFNAGKARAAGEDATAYVYPQVVQHDAEKEFRNPDFAPSGY